MQLETEVCFLPQSTAGQKQAADGKAIMGMTTLRRRIEALENCRSKARATDEKQVWLAVKHLSREELDLMISAALAEARSGIDAGGIGCPTVLYGGIGSSMPGTGSDSSAPAPRRGFDPGGGLAPSLR